MRRRTFLRSALLSSAAALLPACGRPGGRPGGPLSAPRGEVMTVRGPIDAGAMGLTLPHEHLFTDLRPYAEQARAPRPPDVEAVVAVMLPYLERIRALGCRTLVDATPPHLGRHPALLRRLSEASGLHLLTATGAYLAADARFAPPYVTDEPSDALARRWIDEWRDGIDGTGIRPGLIKLGVDGGPLTVAERTLVEAAAAAHRATGLTVATHIGPWGEVEPGHNATSAFEQLALLEAAGVDPSAWVWVHAQSEADVAQVARAARRGAWISLDGFRPGDVDRYVELVAGMRDEGLLHRVLLSQDAGWYTAGEPGGGDVAPYDPLLTTLLPALRAAGFTEDEVDRLVVHNPAAAFAVRVRDASA